LREFQKWRAGSISAATDRAAKVSARYVSLTRLGAAALRDQCDLAAQILDQTLHRVCSRRSFDFAARRRF